jgi:hypothetical protein
VPRAKPTLSKMKSMRFEEPSIDDGMYYARLVMENNPFKERSPAAEDRVFCAMFGCSTVVVLTS